VLRVGIVAGEASGDTLGAGLINAIKERVPDAHFMGVAGPQMIAAGCDPWWRTEELSVMGFAEVLRHLPRLVRLRRGLLSKFKKAKLDVFIGIDSPDFNLPIASALKTTGLPTVQYVSPQVWAWRQSRVGAVSKAVDLILCLLPFETRFYDLHGVNARFVGHPLADSIPMETNKKTVRKILGIPLSSTYLAIFPGSRKLEVSRLARPYMKTAELLCKHNPELKILVGLANEETCTIFSKITHDMHLDSDPILFVGRAREVMGAADVVLTASGTASLETLLVKRPMVVGYMVSGLTYRIMKFLGLNRLNYFSLPNLLADREVVPEFLQGNVRPEILGPALSLFLNRINGQDNEFDWYDSFCSIHQQLRCNASIGAADEVLALLSKPIELS